MLQFEPLQKRVVMPQVGTTSGLWYPLFVLVACSAPPPDPQLQLWPPPGAIGVAPSRPMDFEATAAVRGAHLKWRTPEKGSGPVIRYDVSVTPAAVQTLSLSGDITELDVSGLSNGTTYQFAVVATNAVGGGEAALSNEVTTPDVPSAPPSVTAIAAGERSAMVIWLPPTANGGEPVTSYVVTQTIDGGAVSVGAGIFSTLITNLSRAPQTFTVRAVNAVGPSAESPASNEVVPLARPTAPRGVVASSGNAQATLSWLAPLDPGGMPVTSYLITSSPGALVTMTNGVTTRATVTGLTNGTRYTFTVVAQNSIGPGPRSLPSNFVTPTLKCSGDVRLGGLPPAPVSAFPFAATVADFNADGRADVAIVGIYTGYIGELSIFRGLGNGTLGAPINSPLGSWPCSVVSGDFNGDGHVDLAVTSTETQFRLLFGNGDATFQPAVIYQADRNRTAIISADFNKDGHSDFAVAGGILGSSTVNIFHGSANGTLSRGGTFPLWETLALIAADLTGDGQLDLAAAERDGQISVLVGQADAGFAPRVRYYSAQLKAVAIRSGDFNEDGWVDLAVVGHDVLSILINVGNGTFPFTVGYPISPRYTVAATLVDADLNGDGHQDLVVGGYSTDDVNVLVGDGRGGFAAASAYAVGGSEVLAVGDLNGDHLPDLISRSRSPIPGVHVMLGIGDAGFLATADVFTGSVPVAVAAGDFNHDGRSDLVFGNRDGDTIGIASGNGNSTFQPRIDFPSGPKPSALEVGDLDADGWVDVVIANADGGSVTVLRGTSGGALTPSGNYAAGSMPAAIVIGDFNGDVRMDIVVANTAASQLTVLYQTPTGGFSPPVGIPSGMAPRALAAADFDVDGRLDLAVTTQGGVEILRNTSSGFAGAAVYRVGSDPASIRVGDVDGDRQFDLVVTNALSDNASVLIGRADGTFSTMTVATAPNPGALELDDLDGDGLNDLVIGHRASGNVSLMLGIGDGGFRVPIIHPTRAAPSGVAVSDFNSDGRLDVAVANSGSDSLSVVPSVCLP